MDVNIKAISGSWTLGYSLDKHSIRSTPGYNGAVHMQYGTVRTEAGEALFKLKYRFDYPQVALIAQQLNTSFGSVFQSAGLIIPMPASKARERQPVTEIAREFAKLKAVPYYEN